MTQEQANPPVVVGIDGSKAAVQAALWAAEEAIRDDTTLLLVHVIDTLHPDQGRALEDARHALVEAWEAVTATGKAVKVESEVMHGDPVNRLVNASRNARLLCLGHRGTPGGPMEHRGQTASGVAHAALSTVVLVRHRKEPSPFHQWIVVVLDETPDSDDVLQNAIDEADVRQAPVLALTSWSTTKRRRSKHPSEVRRTLDGYLTRAAHGKAQVCAIPMPDDLLDFLKKCVSIDQLVVVGARNTAVIDVLTSTRAGKIMRKSNVSLMFVRGRSGE